MWTYETESITQKGLKYHLYNEGRALAFDQVIYKWQHTAEFALFYQKMLADAPFDAFYWEHPPMTLKNRDQIYEFVLLPAPQLATVAPERHQFAEHFRPDQQIVEFANLGGDAHLVVPCPQGELDYPHLASFVRTAPKGQALKLWQQLGQCYEAQLSDQPRWLSTAGLGVYWLHLRIDSRPKYYKWGAYR